MASIKEMQTKDGRRYFQIRVSMGKNQPQYKTRLYWQDGWSEKYAQRQALKAAAEFEKECKDGKIENREQKREREKAEAAEAAKLKTVEQYIEGIYMPTKLLTISENTRESYEMFIRLYIVPAIGSMLLVDVTPAIIQRLLRNYQKDHKRSSTMRLYNILNGIFEMAFLDDSIPLSPMLKVKRPAQRKDEAGKPESEKAYTAEEMAYILSCVKAEPLKWQAYINLAADAGMRRGELCGLQWQDIDWKAETVIVCRNLQYTTGKGVYITNPKSGKTRLVDIGKETLDLLRALRDEQSHTCVSRWVFTDGTPEPMNPQTPTRYFQRFGTRYQVRDFHPHMLRHTSASIAITSGADVVSVSQRLGHADTALTLRMYAHANEDSIRRAGQTLRDALKEAQGR